MLEIIGEHPTVRFAKTGATPCDLYLNAAGTELRSTCEIMASTGAGRRLQEGQDHGQDASTTNELLREELTQLWTSSNICLRDLHALKLEVTQLHSLKAEVAELRSLVASMRKE